MMSKIPVDLSKTNSKEIDREVLRAAIIAELDAVNLYEQMAAVSSSGKIRKVMLDVAKEEKTHVGEFQALLLELDREQEEELRHGRDEVNELSE